MDFSKKLIKWYGENQRDLPWRKTTNPYFIWLSEIILQQTRVAQGLDYYLKFVELFPTVQDLANAKEETVIKTWQGLGYYSRARNLHATAKIICDDYNGEFPAEYNELIKLKGVGDYTASAISSFAFKKPYAVLDGNVYRVLSRIFDIDLPIDSNSGKKYFRELAQELINVKKPDFHNQAIMEFGALCCLPKKPHCEDCVLHDSCLALKNDTVSILPIKEKKIKKRTRYFNYLVVSNHTDLIIHKRTEKDIWENLFDFPLIETEDLNDEQTIIGSEQWKHFFNDHQVTIKNISNEFKHVLTHQTLKVKFWEIELSSLALFQISNQYKIIKKIDFQELPVPKLIENYLTLSTLSFAKP
ncbi:MAG: A/G-specific adenine glycosylase [Flavobacteriales bacterium]|nr:A/G-specific adenine glycosylase [Flavobacteriales bacterium]